MSEEVLKKTKIQWYPGHMTKARREMEESVKLIDLVIEIADARAVMSSLNPDINRIANGKVRMMILNKSDLADEAVNKAWVEYFQGKGIKCICLDSRKNNSMNPVRKAIEEVCSDKIERDRKRGIKGRPVRAMVVGIPNVGKSTFINSFSGKSVAKTGNKPGVTKGKQWIRIDKNCELLDTPGILWPKFEDAATGEHLAFIGSISDEVVEQTDLCIELVAFLKTKYPGVLSERFGVDESLEAGTFLNEVADKRKLLKKGSEPDYDRTVRVIIDEFRSGKIGRISIENPEDYQ